MTTDQEHRDPVETNPKPERLTVIDHLRGSAMILMAIDHSMSFAGVPPVAESYGGVIKDLGPTILVLIGLATNIASGIFFVLAGTSIAFFEASRLRRGWTQGQITRFLLIRGVILLVLDMLVEPFAWNGPVAFDTLSALGSGIIVLAFARRLSPRTLLFLSLFLFIIYPILVATVPLPETTLPGFVTTILLQYHPQGAPNVEFPLLARLSLVLFGNYFGVMLKQGRITISGSIAWVGVIGLIVTLILRLAGGYGNFLPYKAGSPWILFFIDDKQPPSTVFLLFNFSLAVLLMAGLLKSHKLLESTKVAPILRLFGQTALFFFVIHLLLYSKVVSRLGDLHLVARTWELVLLEFTAGIAIMIPVCALYRALRRKYPNSVLHYL